MGVFLNNLYNYIMLLISSSSIYGSLLACLLIFLESIIPILPLFVFIGIMMLKYGYFLGFIISYVLTCLGCFMAFYLSSKINNNYIVKKIKKNFKFIKKLNKISLCNLALIIAIPFTPAFLVNILSSISGMSFKKYSIAILIGKIFLIFFWGFIATSLVESLKNPKILILIIFMLLIAYIIAKIVNKQFQIK